MWGDKKIITALVLTCGHPTPELSSPGHHLPFPQSPALSPVFTSLPPAYLSWKLEVVEQQSQEFIKVPAGPPALTTDRRFSIHISPRFSHLWRMDKVASRGSHSYTVGESLILPSCSGP